MCFKICKWWEHCAIFRTSRDDKLLQCSTDSFHRTVLIIMAQSLYLTLSFCELQMLPIIILALTTWLWSYKITGMFKIVMHVILFLRGARTFFSRSSCRYKTGKSNRRAFYRADLKWVSRGYWPPSRFSQIPFSFSGTSYMLNVINGRLFAIPVAGDRFRILSIGR